MAIFPGEPGLAHFIEAKDDGSGGDDWSYVVQSSSQIITTNKHPTFYRSDALTSCHPTNSVKALKGKLCPWIRLKKVIRIFWE